MTSGITTFLCLIVMLCFTWPAFAEQENITAEPGQDVILTCRAPDNNSNVVEWSRADLKTKHVLVYRNGAFLSKEQHPYFANRVDLQDHQMKDGDVSLILKNVTINDTGTYECRVQRVIPIEVISTINLRIDPPGPTGGQSEDGGREDGVSRGHYGLISFSLLLLLIAALVITGKLLKKNEAQQLPAD